MLTSLLAVTCTVQFKRRQSYFTQIITVIKAIAMISCSFENFLQIVNSAPDYLALYIDVIFFHNLLVRFHCREIIKVNLLIVISLAIVNGLVHLL